MTKNYPKIVAKILKMWRKLCSNRVMSRLQILMNNLGFAEHSQAPDFRMRDMFMNLKCKQVNRLRKGGGNISSAEKT